MRASPLAALLSGAVAAGVARADPPPAPAPYAPSRTVLAPHPGVPIEPGKNVLWCATVQLAWDALADAFGKNGRLDPSPGVDASTVEALNRREFPRADLRPRSFVVAAGEPGPELFERVRRELADKFPGLAPPDALRSGRNPVAFAHLEKDLPFAHPFTAHTQPLVFAGGEKRVASFGLPAWRGARAAEEVAAQAAVHLPRADPAKPEGAVPPRAPTARTDPPFVVELTPADPSDVIFLARVPQGRTLEDTWRTARGLVLHGERHVLGAGDDLVVPRVGLDVERRILGTPEEPATSDRPTIVHRVRLGLDERGARLRSTVVVDLGIHRALVFDGPFLLALMGRQASRPYLLLWVDNDEILEAARSERPDVATLRALTGTWRVDPERTRDLAMKAWAEDPSSVELDPEIVRAAGEDLVTMLRHLGWTFVFGPDGTGTCSSSPPDSEPTTAPVEVRVDGTDLSVRMRDPETYIPLDRQDGLLILRLALPFGPPALVFAKD